MRTLLPDPPPAAFAELLAERTRRGLDRHDEVWEGVLHMIPPPSRGHERLLMRLGFILTPHVDATGFELAGGIAIGTQDDYRVPDFAIVRPGGSEQWHSTAALCGEILSPNDETWDKLPFYAAHRVDEVLILDPAQQRVHWHARADTQYRPTEHSGLIELGPRALARALGWPA